MPTRPSTNALSANSAKILNTIQANATPYYRSMISQVDENNLSSLRAVGTTLLNNDGLMNEFLTSLINRVAMVWVSSKLYTNPWAFMKKGMLELGEVIEDVFVELAKPHLYNVQEAEQKVMQREIPDVDAVFHKLNYQVFYKQTIQNDSLRQAFLTWDGITDLIARITNAMYSAVAYDEFLVTKYMIAMAVANGDMWTEQVGTVSKETMDDVVTAMKAVSNLLTFMSGNYNAAGVDTYTDKTDQYIIINSRFDASMAVNVLATAFNEDRATLMGRVILVDDFGTFDMKRLKVLLGGMPNFTTLTPDQITALSQIPAVLVDRSWFMIFDQLLKFTEIYNSQGLYWNYTLHAWKIFSYSPFANAIAFTPDAQTVTSVTVNPTAATLAPGAEMTFTAQVTGSTFVSQGVVWTTNNDDVPISSGGKIRIPSSGVTGTVTVTATSKQDSTKSASAIITIS